jgi:hypothetical protein
MKLTWAYPPQSYLCPFIDLNKSKPYLDDIGVLQNKESLPFWSATNTLIRDVEHFKALIAGINKIEYKVNCSHCKRELVRFWVEEGKKGRTAGIIGLRFTKHLLSYRPRADGLLGLECICGLGDTRLSSIEKIRNPDLYPDRVPYCSSDEARFNDGKKFKTEIV